MWVMVEERGDERVEYIPGMTSIRRADLPMMLQGKNNNSLNIASQVFSWSRPHRPQYLIFTSIYQLEPHVIDALRISNLPVPIHTIGPVIPYFKLQNHTQPTTYLEWLDAQPTGSVLYVSMGSLVSISRAQTEELAAGLRDAGIRYLWVARGQTSFQEPGSQEEEEGMGLVVSWCDQLRVLCHPSVGGFWTHCGWNSTVEGAFAGVPMLTFPMIADQLPNSQVIVESWKIGWRVRGERIVDGGDSLVPRDEIVRLVQRFMDVEDEEMIQMRKRAREVRQICQGAIAPGGSSDIHLRAVIEKIFSPQSHSHQ